MNILVSACLLGSPCRYDGKSKPNETVLKLKEKHRLIPVCPEMAGGLKVPRVSCEVVSQRVIDKNGEDKTSQYEKGARCALFLAEKYGCEYAILKEKSPSCGFRQIYDGTFSKTLTDKMGITAKLLFENGIKILGESEAEKLIWPNMK